VEAALRADELVAVLTADEAHVATGHLERRLVGLRAAVAQVDAIGEGPVHEALSKIDRGLVEVEVADVQQRTRLLPDGSGELGVAVPEAAHGDARREVEVATSGPIHEMDAVTLDEDHRLLPIVRGEHPTRPLEERLLRLVALHRHPVPSLFEVSDRVPTSAAPECSP
jgi:hypothetical protein